MSLILLVPEYIFKKSTQRANMKRSAFVASDVLMRVLVVTKMGTYLIAVLQFVTQNFQLIFFECTFVPYASGLQ